VLAALNTSLDQRRPRGLIHHSDHGCKPSYAFGKRCQETNVMPSKGDNFYIAMAESFFANLEPGVLARRSFRTCAKARIATFEQRSD
jgi:putative transposase